jgi:hypothetical protein
MYFVNDGALLWSPLAGQALHKEAIAEAGGTCH